MEREPDRRGDDQRIERQTDGSHKSKKMAGDLKRKPATGKNSEPGGRPISNTTNTTH